MVIRPLLVPQCGGITVVGVSTVGVRGVPEMPNIIALYVFVGVNVTALTVLPRLPQGIATSNPKSRG